MVPLDAFLMSSAQACREGFSGCCAGTQLDILRFTGLSCASADRDESASTAASTARGWMRGFFMKVSWLDRWAWGEGNRLCFIRTVGARLSAFTLGRVRQSAWISRSLMSWLKTTVSLRATALKASAVI